MPANPRTYSLTVDNDYDVVTMRQDVRQQARALGLNLIQQAKLASAISAVARALLSIQQTTTFTMQTTHVPRPAYEIACVAPLEYLATEPVELEQTLHMDEARLLVDEACLVLDQKNLRLTLRMWLGNVSSKV